MFTNFYTKIIDFFTVLILKNLKKIGDFALLLLAIGIVTFAVYYSDNRQAVNDKENLDDCKAENRHKDSVIKIKDSIIQSKDNAVSAIYERFLTITINKPPLISK